MANMVIRSLPKIIAGDPPEVHEPPTGTQSNVGRVQSSEHAIFAGRIDGAFPRPHQTSYELVAGIDLSRAMYPRCRLPWRHHGGQCLRTQEQTERIAG